MERPASVSFVTSLPLTRNEYGANSTLSVLSIISGSSPVRMGALLVSSAAAALISGALSCVLTRIETQFFR
jgi:hypothetical protein